MLPVRIGLIVTLGLALAACGEAQKAPVVAAAPAPAEPAKTNGTAYGPGVTEGPVLTVAELFAKADEMNGKVVRVRGMVADVCAKRGCWIKVGEESDPRTVTFKVTDGVIVFPMSARGKGVVAEGTCEKRKLTLERTREMKAHEAEESGVKFDPATVTEPMDFVMLKGIGAVVGE